MIDPSTPFAIVTAPKRDSLHWKPGTVTWGELVEWMGSPAKKKEAGNYLLGTLQPTYRVHDKDHPEDRCLEMHRIKQAVVSRSCITLDVDKADRTFAEAVELAFPYAAIMHTTYSSAPDEPRYRLIIPADRELLPDEYVIAAKAIMQMLGTEAFDPGSSQPERYMFRPAAQKPQWFQWWELEGDPVPVDELLEGFEEDLSDKELPRPHKNKRDPFEIDGVIGAFNRAYDDWDTLIEVYELPYEKVDTDRYQLVGARSQAGMGPVQGVEGLVYSHHANDPAYGKTCSAFDLVRLHRFGELDEAKPAQTPVNKLPSHEAMLELASLDHRVTAQLVGVDFDEEMDEDVAGPNDWKLGLRLGPRTGKPTDDVRNWDLIRENDPVFTVIHYNELTLAPEAIADLPWRKPTRLTRTITEADRYEIMDYIEREYGIRPLKQRVDAMVDITAHRNKFNPVADYLEKLQWDGTPRVETSLPGVAVTPFTRRVARLVLVAAVARMLDPGVKFDHTLVLYGTEGLGKSWWIDKISKGWSSSLGRIDNKDTLLVMQRSWIMTADEGHSLKKADNDAMKEFLTRTTDVFRLPYEKDTGVHPRHCVIWSTTNDETFLRRQQGNRRFLIVHCEEKVDFDKFTDDYVDQMWAEAVELYRAGTPLYMSDTEAELAAVERERFTEEDSLSGAVEEYLNRLVPMSWNSMSPEQRVNWISDRAMGFEAEGDVMINQVCSRQIWFEALRMTNNPRRTDLLEITEALTDMPGWHKLPGRHRLPGYGPQMVFERDEDLL